MFLALLDRWLFSFILLFWFAALKVRSFNLICFVLWVFHLSYMFWFVFVWSCFVSVVSQALEPNKLALLIQGAQSSMPSNAAPWLHGYRGTYAFLKFSDSCNDHITQNYCLRDVICFFWREGRWSRKDTFLDKSTTATRFQQSDLDNFAANATCQNLIRIRSSASPCLDYQGLPLKGSLAI